MQYTLKFHFFVIVFFSFSHFVWQHPSVRILRQQQREKDVRTVESPEQLQSQAQRTAEYESIQTAFTTCSTRVMQDSFSKRRRSSLTYTSQSEVSRVLGSFPHYYKVGKRQCYGKTYRNYQKVIFYVCMRAIKPFTNITLRMLQNTLSVEFLNKRKMSPET